MMILLLVLILAGIALWYLVFVVLCHSWRRNGRLAVAAPTSANRTDPTQLAAMGWTALDDQQLIRLLKGSAP